MTTPSLHKSFEQALLFGCSDDNEVRLLLQVCGDYDVIRRLLDKQLGQSVLASRPGDFVTDDFASRCRKWSVSSQKQYDQIFETYFRPYKKPNEVRNKPPINYLLLMPCVLDHPIVPNDIGDRQ